jgi:hypothetical protein
MENERLKLYQDMLSCAEEYNRYYFGLCSIYIRITQRSLEGDLWLLPELKEAYESHPDFLGYGKRDDYWLPPSMESRIEILKKCIEKITLSSSTEEY